MLHVQNRFCINTGLHGLDTGGGLAWVKPISTTCRVNCQCAGLYKTYITKLSPSHQHDYVMNEYYSNEIGDITQLCDR